MIHVIVENKICTCCGLEKASSEFGINKSMKNSLDSYCEDCSKEKNRQRRLLIQENGREYEELFQVVNWYQNKLAESSISQNNQTLPNQNLQQESVVNQ